jgi:hypothetical protein
MVLVLMVIGDTSEDSDAADTSDCNDNNQPDNAWPTPPPKKSRQVYSEADA